MIILAWVLFGALSALVIKYLAHGKYEWRSFDVLDVGVVLLGGLAGPLFLLLFLIVATVIYVGENANKELFYLGKRKEEEKEDDE